MRQRGSAVAAPLPGVLVASGADKFSLLESVLRQSQFWSQLDAIRLAARETRKRLSIIVKPDLTVFDQHAFAATDPELVEHLIDLLHDRGFQQVSIGVAGDTSELWLENRDPVVLADMAGYRFSTGRGRDYEVIDLSQDLVSAGFAAGTTLHGVGVGRAWSEAHVRINFAKNKTDEQYGYALGLHNLLNIHPSVAKDPYYLHRVLASDVVLDILHLVPPHFTVIDAFVSNHGNAGTRVRSPIDTRTIIAGSDAVLTDWAAALKMGLDPHVSSINAQALRESQSKFPSHMIGPLQPYKDWINVTVRLRDSVCRRNRSVEMMRTIRPWFQSLDRDLFPFKNALDERLNALFCRRFSDIDKKVLSRLTLTVLNYSLAAGYENIQSAFVLYAKDRLHRTERPLNIRLADYKDAAYDAVVDYIEPLERVVRDIPGDSNGLKWRYLDDSVLFEGSRVLPIPYSDFVSKVDISASVRLMNDYIGGAYVPVSSDRHGRIIRQAERNIFLAQPNYLVLSGGQPIDVTKLEYCRYERAEQKIFWRTIKSDNSSARFDDGCVAFTNLGRKRTRISIVGLQQFGLPLLWQAVNLGLYPELKDNLVSQAYTTFLTHTFANFEAKYEGRDIRIGRGWPSVGSGDSLASDADWKEGLVDMIGSLEAKVTGSVKQVLERSTFWKRQRRPGSSLDDEGFSHFAGDQRAAAPASDMKTAVSAESGFGAEAREFFSDLVAAVRQDFDSQ